MLFKCSPLVHRHSCEGWQDEIIRTQILLQGLWDEHSCCCGWKSALPHKHLYTCTRGCTGFYTDTGEGSMELLSINQPLPNSSQVRNVPSVITLGPVQQSINRGVHRNFVRIRYFEAGFSFSLRVKNIYLLGTKIRHFFLSPPLLTLYFFFLCVFTCRKKKHTLPPSPSSTLFCSFSSLTIIFFWEHTCCVFGGRLTVIFPPWKGHDSKSAPLENTLTLPSLSQPDAPGPARVCSHLL